MTSRLTEVMMGVTITATTSPQTNSERPTLPGPGRNSGKKAAYLVNQRVGPLTQLSKTTTPHSP